MLSVVNPVNVVRNPLSTALIIIDSAGHNIHTFGKSIFFLRKAMLAAVVHCERYPTHGVTRFKMPASPPGSVNFYLPADNKTAFCSLCLNSANVINTAVFRELQECYHTSEVCQYQIAAAK